MLRQQVSPKVAAIATLVILAAIQFAYWRMLVYQPPGTGPGPGGGGGPPEASTYAVGLAAVTVDTLAGEDPGYADGPSWKARFCGPNALAVEPDGDLLVADSRNHRVRRVTPKGNVTTVAGGGDPSGPGGRSEGLALEAEFRYPSGVATASDGTIYISDTGNHRICRLLAGPSGGTVSSLAGGAEGDADGQGTAARFRSPAALTVDTAGAVWVFDSGNRAIRRIDPNGNVTTPAAVPAPVRVALGEHPSGRSPLPLSAWAEGEGEPTGTEFSTGRHLPGAARGGLRVLADGEHHVLLVRTGDGQPFLLAGRRDSGGVSVGSTDGEGRRASFARPCAVAAAPDGSFYVAEYEGSRIRRVRIPDWLLDGHSAPPRRNNRPWRGRSGNRGGPVNEGVRRPGQGPGQHQPPGGVRGPRSPGA